MSQIVAETSLRRILEAVEDASEDVMVASLADNIIILCSSMAAAKASMIALHHAALLEFGKDVADGLQTRKETFDPEEGVRFLGLIWTWKQGALARSLIPGAGQAFVTRIMADMLNYELPDESGMTRLRAWLKYADFDPVEGNAAIKAAQECGF